VTDPRGSIRLVDLLAALSLVTDDGSGLPPEHALRTCFLATELARRTNLPEEDGSTTFFAALLRHVGCTALAPPGPRDPRRSASRDPQSANPRVPWEGARHLGRRSPRLARSCSIEQP